MQYPTIRIKDAWLLRGAASTHLHKLWGEGKKLANDKDMKRIVENYNKAWKPYEEKIVKGMCETLGLEFRQNIIDVYIAPWFRAFSDPMVVGVIYKPDEFIDILTHELLHRLLTDNTSVPYDAPLGEEWKKLFGDKHSFITLVHIPVHATHQAIYTDILKEPYRIEREIARCKKHNATDYVASWEYVEKHAYKNIVKQLKESYENLSKSR